MLRDPVRVQAALPPSRCARSGVLPWGPPWGPSPVLPGCVSRAQSPEGSAHAPELLPTPGFPHLGSIGVKVRGQRSE